MGEPYNLDAMRRLQLRHEKHAAFSARMKVDRVVAGMKAEVARLRKELKADSAEVLQVWVDMLEGRK